jgi:hypothetical protein
MYSVLIKLSSQHLSQFDAMPIVYFEGIEENNRMKTLSVICIDRGNMCYRNMITRSFDHLDESI